MLHILLWLLFLLLMIVYPIYFFIFKNKIKSKLYQGLILLLPVIGFMQFVGLITILPSEEVSFLHFSLSSILFGIHAYKVVFKKIAQVSKLDLVFVLTYIVLTASLFIEML